MASGPSGGVGDRQVLPRWVEAAHVCVAAGRADQVGGHDKAGAGDGVGRDGVAQVDGWPLGIGAAEISQRGESLVEVVVDEAQPDQSLGGIESSN